jgi:hypothetical protein
MGLIQFLRNRFAKQQTYPIMPFVIGAPRSGTTLLRLMLDAHPELSIPPETGFVSILKQHENISDIDLDTFFQYVTHFPANSPNWDDFVIERQVFRRQLESLNPFTVADGFRTFYRLYAARFGKSRWGDKTPTYFRYMNEIAETLPEARFVHIIRDGRDVALSLRDLWFSPGRDMETLAEHWKAAIHQSRAWGEGHKLQYLEIFYEDLIVQPESTLRTVCNFIELPFAPEILTYHQSAPERLKEQTTRFKVDGTVLATQEQRLSIHRLTLVQPDESRIGVWKREMSDEERARYEAIGGDLLKQLGYEV